MTYVSPTKAFAHLDRLAAWQAGGSAAPVTVEWDLSNACSLGCQDCHFAHTHLRGPWAAKARPVPSGYSDTGLFADEALVKRGLAQAAAAGLRAVVWSGGGEPTLHTRWTEILRHGASQGLRQGMYTLGGHVDAAGAAVLGEVADWVVVSLDAAEAEAYAREKAVPASRYAEALRGVGLLAKTPVVVGVSFLLHGTNWHHAARMLSVAREAGATYATFRPAILTQPDRPQVPTAGRGWVTEAMPTLRWLADQMDVECDPGRFAQWRDWDGHGYSACHGIKLATVVTPDGRMWVCPQRRGVQGSCLGDLRAESWEQAWARHPGAWTNFTGCRAMCRLHLVNQALAPVFATQAHEAFI